MNFNKFVVKTQSLLHKNSQNILTSFGITGVVTTAYLSAKASFQSARDLDEFYMRYPDEVLDFKESAKLVWRNYIPAILSGSATVTCVLGAQKVSSRKTAAAQAAFALSERVFNEYKDKVIEQIGPKKEQEIRDKMAQSRVTENDPNSRQVIVTGNGTVLCCEGYTGRYFNSDMESLRKAENQINSKLNNHDSATLSDLYYLLNIPDTKVSSDLGWDSGRLLELEFSTTITPDGKPCLVFNYNYIRTV
jgi:hypothetical protein